MSAGKNMQEQDNGSIFSAAARQRESLRAGIFGLLANVLLSAIKLTAGLISRSVSIIADAANSMSDASSSILSLIGVRLSAKPADEEHPFGHGRIEYLSALFISIVMILVGFSSLWTGIRKIISPELTSFGILPLAILLVSVLIKCGLAFFYGQQARKLSSAVLSAAAVDARNDLLVTGAAIVVMLVEKYFQIPVDGYVGTAVSLFVIVSGFSVMKDTTLPLIGEAQNPELCEKISSLVESTGGILGTHDLIVHSYGPDRHIASIHAEVASTLSLEEAHRIADAAERAVRDKLGVQLVIHADPVSENDPVIETAKKELETVISRLDPSLTYHDFRIVHGKSHINLVFDLVLPYSYDASRQEALVQELKAAMQKSDPRYHCHITCDRK